LLHLAGVRGFPLGRVHVREFFVIPEGGIEVSRKQTANVALLAVGSKSAGEAVPMALAPDDQTHAADQGARCRSKK